MFVFIHSLGKRLGRAHHIVVRGEQLVEGAARFSEQAPSLLECRLLPQESDACAGVEPNLAFVSLIETGKKAKEGRFAGAVGADKSDAIAALKLEADALEKGPFIEAACQAGTAHQKHCVCLSLSANGWPCSWTASFGQYIFILYADKFKI
jgi:hypothetical protein